MKKFLIVTKEKDFIVNKMQLSKIKEDKTNMIYNTEGYWIHKDESIHGNCDGTPREWAIDFLQSHKVGDSVPDVVEWWAKKLKEE